MYLMLGTRPDIAYAITKLAQFASTPTERHWREVLRVLKYLCSYHSVRLCLGLTRPPITLSPSSELIGYFDSSLMDCTRSRKSTGAYIFSLHGSCVSWASKKQGRVALSSTEAEYIARTEAAKEVSWILSLLSDIGLTLTSIPYLLGDNQGALAMAKNNDFRPRTKHIHVRKRFITDMVTKGSVTVSYVPTKHMIADALTKALPREQHEVLTGLIGLEYGDHYKKVCHNCKVVF